MIRNLKLGAELGFKPRFSIWGQVSPTWHFYIYNFYIFFLIESYREKNEVDTEVFHPLVHSSKEAHQTYVNLARPSIQEFHQGLQYMNRYQALRPSSTALPRDRVESEAGGTRTGTHWGQQHCRWWTHLLCHNVDMSSSPTWHLNHCPKCLLWKNNFKVLMYDRCIT